jgi:hypothetical protein
MGAGGSSIGIAVQAGSTLTQTGNTFNIGLAGKGGASPTVPGPDGEAAEVKQFE